MLRVICLLAAVAFSTGSLDDTWDIESPPIARTFFGYRSEVGACRGGPSNCGLAFFSDTNCETRCNNDNGCTGFMIDQTPPATWCETYTCAEPSGDGRTAFICNIKTCGRIDFEEDLPIAGLSLDDDADCEEHCNKPNCDELSIRSKKKCNVRCSGCHCVDPDAKTCESTGDWANHRCRRKCTVDGSCHAECGEKCSADCACNNANKDWFSSSPLASSF